MMAPAPVVEGELMALNLTEDALYFVDRRDGTPISGLVNRYYGAIKRYDLSGGQTTTLFATERSDIMDLLVTADALYVATRITGGPDIVNVYRLPLSGEGMAVPVSPAWSMGESAFVRSALVGSVGDVLVVDGFRGTMALSLTDGSVRRLVPASEQLVSMQLLGNQLWYGTEQGRGGIFRVEVSAPGSMPVEVYPKGCSNGVLGKTGWFLATSGELACGGNTTIQGLAPDGSGEARSWDLTGIDPTPYYPTYSDNDALYLASDDTGVRVPRSGGSPEYFSCEAVPVDGIRTNANWFVWGRGLQPNAGVFTAATPVVLGPAVFSAIYAKRR
ncbi:MAG: hypothetical protein ABI895_24175 [Deltaproteobacteria bacterium]